MKRLITLFLSLTHSLFVIGQELAVSKENTKSEIIEESEKFFFENLIKNKINKEFTSVKIREQIYSLQDPKQLEKYAEYSYFKRPGAEFRREFFAFLILHVFQSNDNKTLADNLNYILPFASNELYDYSVMEDGLKTGRLTLEITTPFRETVYQKEIRRIYFHSNGLIDKVEQLIESRTQPDTLLQNSITTFTYSKNRLKEKRHEHFNVFTKQITQVNTFKFNSIGQLKETNSDRYSFSAEGPKISTNQTNFIYYNGNLIALQFIFKGKVINGYSIFYNKRTITVNQLTPCMDCASYEYQLVN
jgi:hypothetical protein